MKTVFSILALSLAFANLVACSSTSDNSLLTNDATSASSSVNTTPNATELSIASDAGSIVIPSGADQFEISGNCYTSTYTAHYITVSLVNLNANTSSQLATMDPKLGANSNQSLCRNGRYDVIVYSGALASGSNSVKVQLYVLDNGSYTTNDANSSQVITVIK
ncbi:MAG TPA: hypothetical protein VF412_04450 [Bdellovibrio sp.]|uniref:hypothetical protein n=1 Tax=Bdellovibrio sp. TaxID=28201 RepID=UPI002F1AC182